MPGRVATPVQPISQTQPLVWRFRFTTHLKHGPSLGDVGSSCLSETPPSFGDCGSSYVLGMPSHFAIPVHHVS